MKIKKVFIISFNCYTKEFWKQVLNLNQVDLYHWKDYHNGINNFTTVWPDIIIIEGGYPTKSITLCVESALKLKCNSKVFWIDPTSSVDSEVESNKRLVVAPLSSDLVNQINRNLHPVTIQPHLN